MYKLRVSPAILENRLDCGFYNPVGLEYTELLRINSDLMPLSDLVDPDRKITNGVRGPDWQDSKYKLIRLQDCDHWIVNHEEAESISFAQFEENRRCRLKVNDIVVAIGGYVGNAAVLTEDCFAVIGQHSAVLPEPEKKGIDSRYLLAYLNSKVAEAIFSRYVSGTVQAGINLEDLRLLPAPIVDSLAQKYIGDKVRQAEQLRAWAKRCRGKINDYFDGLFTGISLTKPEHHHTRVSLDILVPRLNAEYYSDHYTQVEKGLLDRFGKLTTLGRLAPTVRAKVKPAADCTYKEIGDLDVGKGAFSSGTFYKYGEVPNNAKRIFDEGDVAVSTRRPNRGAVAVIEESSSTTFYSVFLARLKPKNKNFGYWLKEFLRHDAGKLLLLQRCTWTTYPVISEDDIETIPVPEIPNDWDFVARLSRQSVELEAFATNLTTSAKTLVEALIEGQLTEQQLIQAQQALDDGDNSLDQAILSKLSGEGYGIANATPLFSDIDELYRLLESAAQAEAEE